MGANWRILARFSMLNDAKWRVLARFVAQLGYGVDLLIYKDLARNSLASAQEGWACSRSQRRAVSPLRRAMWRDVLRLSSIVRREGEMICKAVVRNISRSGFLLSRVLILRCAAELYLGTQTPRWNLRLGSRATCPTGVEGTVEIESSWAASQCGWQLPTGWELERTGG